MSHELGVYWHRKGNPSDNAAHHVEEELKESASNPEQAHQKLLDTMLVVGAMSSSMQNEFLRNLQEDDPSALEKLGKILPEMKITGAGSPAKSLFFTPDQYGPIRFNVHLTPERALEIGIASEIAENGIFPFDSQMRKIARQTIIGKGKQSEAVSAINHALEAVGDSDPTDRVAVGSPSKAGEPQEIILLDEKGRKRSSL